MDENCTIYKTSEFIGKKWTLLIILELYRDHSKPRRYNELKNRLPGITSKILSLRLKELEKIAIIKKRIDTSVFPVKCEYSLTKKGMDFIKALKEIKKWSLRWDIKNKICGSLDCSRCAV
jgi:DNA-binding HxlR family transcriptional regulator